ncbi:pentapeptide repeat-containing protein, partial [Cyanobium sp. BA20m-p-22]
MAGGEGSPQSLEELNSALAAGQRQFPGLRLRDLDGVDLDLSNCDLRASCFKEARFGRARFHRSQLEGCRFQQALLWGADLSEAQAQRSFWHEADLSGSRL